MSTNNLPRAVIFDMDGVIFDTERAWIECWEPVGKAHHIPDLERVLREDCVGITASAMHQRMLEVYGQDFPYEQYRREAYEVFERTYRHNLPVKKGVRELLSFLKENYVPVALASSTGSETVRSELTEAGFIDYFDVIVGGEMVSRSKPAPDIFLLAAKKLGVEPAQCYVIEDARFGIQAASAAGMKPIMVPDLQQPDEATRNMCVAVLSSLIDVRDYYSRPFQQ